MGAIKMLRLDYLTMKPHFKTFGLVILFIAAFWFMGSSINMVLINCAWYMALMAANIFAIEEKHNMNRLYGALAFDIKSIVFGRYLFAFSLHLITVIVVIICAVILPNLHLFSSGLVRIKPLFLPVSLSFLIFSLIVSSQLPLYFKWGYSKARMLSIIPFFLIIALAAAINFAAPLNLVDLVIANEGKSAIIFTILGAIVLTTSCLISILIRKKQK